MFLLCQHYFLVLYALLTHPFYISLTDAVYNPQNASLEIAQKIFWDDLEVALSRIHGKKIDFLKPGSDSELDKQIELYLLEHNVFVINGQAAQLRYLGYEIDDDAAWFYLEALAVPQPKRVDITNTLLYEDFPTQQNIVNVYMSKSPKSIIANRGTPKGTLNF